MFIFVSVCVCVCVFLCVCVLVFVSMCVCVSARLYPCLDYGIIEKKMPWVARTFFYNFGVCKYMFFITANSLSKALSFRNIYILSDKELNEI